MPITTPNMLLIKPDVGSTPGPDWATDLNGDLNSIDSHNHTTNQGIQIPAGGINLQSDLTLNSNQLTNVKSVVFATNGSPLATTSALYESGVDLYFTDGGNNVIRITQNGVLVASGAISGLPNGTAGVAYSGGVFTFSKATNTPASMNQGPTTIRQGSLNGFGTAIQIDPTQSSNLILTLPTVNGSNTNVLSTNGAGALSWVSNIPVTPCFSAYRSAGNITFTNAGYVQVTFQTTEWNTTSSYSTGTSTFTPSIAGKYLLTVTLSWKATSGDIPNIAFAFNGSTGAATTKIQHFYMPVTATNVSSTFSAMMQFNGTGDFVQVFVTNSTGNTGTVGNGQNEVFFQAQYAGS